MKPPQNPKSVLAFMNFFRNYVPNFASETASLRSLLKTAKKTACWSNQFDSLPTIVADFGCKQTRRASPWTVATCETVGQRIQKPERCYTDCLTWPTELRNYKGSLVLNQISILFRLKWIVSTLHFKGTEMISTNCRSPDLQPFLRLLTRWSCSLESREADSHVPIYVGKSHLVDPESRSLDRFHPKGPGRDGIWVGILGTELVSVEDDIPKKTNQDVPMGSGSSGVNCPIQFANPFRPSGLAKGDLVMLAIQAHAWGIIA